MYTKRLGHYGSGIHNEAGTLCVRYAQCGWDTMGQVILRLGHNGSGRHNEAGTQWVKETQLGWDAMGQVYTMKLGHYRSCIHNEARLGNYGSGNTEAGTQWVRETQ